MTSTKTNRQHRDTPHRNWLLWGIGVLSIALFASLLFFGSVELSFSRILGSLSGGSDEMARMIVVELRLPMACAAVLCGIALSLAGLLLQTTFNNPLAGPSILGVSTGASLGVAIVLLALGGGAAIGIGHYTGAMAGSIVGAAAMLLLLLMFSRIVRGAAMLLIIGVLLGYLASSAISILNFYATTDGVYSFVIWGLGSFSGVTLTDIAVFGTLILICVIATFAMIKPLNAMLLGDEYARSMGINIVVARTWLLALAGLLTAAATSFCGPIGFIGLVVPHMARLTLQTSNHRKLLPAVIVWGGFAGLLTAAISVFVGGASVLPINAITPVLSVPIIIYVIVKRNRISYFQ